MGVFPNWGVKGARVAPRVIFREWHPNMVLRGVDLQAVVKFWAPRMIGGQRGALLVRSVRFDVEPFVGLRVVGFDFFRRDHMCGAFWGGAQACEKFRGSFPPPCAPTETFAKSRFWQIAPRGFLRPRTVKPSTPSCRRENFTYWGSFWRRWRQRGARGTRIWGASTPSPPVFLRGGLGARGFFRPVAEGLAHVP